MNGYITIDFSGYSFVTGTNTVSEEIFRRIEYAFKHRKSCFAENLVIDGTKHSGYTQICENSADDYLTHIITVGGAIYELNCYYSTEAGSYVMLIFLHEFN